MPKFTNGLNVTAGTLAVGGSVTIAAATGVITGLTTTQPTLNNSTALASTAYADAAVAVEKTRALAAETLLATDSLVVHLAGTETITGAKTFSATTTAFVNVVVTGLVEYKKGVGLRWTEQLDGTTESGFNAGSNWTLNAWDDTSGPLGAYVTVNRASGNTTFVGSVAAGAFSGSGSGLTGIPESGVTNLTTDLAAKAADGLVVHLAGTETVTGVKTFSANVGIGITPTYSLHAYGGGGRLQFMASATAPAATVNSSGGVSFWYAIVAEDRNGFRSLCSAASSQANSTTTPNNTITWSAVTGAAKYYVLRATSNNFPAGTGGYLVGTWTSGPLTFTDTVTNGSQSSFAIPARNLTADLTVDGVVTATSFTGSSSGLTGLLTSVALTSTSPGLQVVVGTATPGSPSLQIAFNITSANLVLAGPASGSAAAPTLRALVPADLGVASPGMCQGRLTLTTGVGVTTSDVLAATTLYFTPYLGSMIGLYSGSAWVMLQFAETSVSLSGFALSTNFDVFAYNNGGTLALETLAWSNNTARATALVLQNGVLVKSGATTRRYLGTFRTTGTTGQTEDSLLNRLVWNLYNQIPRLLQATDPTGNWSYTTAAWRPGNNNTANRVNLVVGYQTAKLRLDLAVVTGAVGGVAACIGIGEDSTTSPHAYSQGDYGVYNTSTISTCRASLDLYPSAGSHYYQWLEYGGATQANFYSNTITGLNSGLAGFVMG